MERDDLMFFINFWIKRQKAAAKLDWYKVFINDDKNPFSLNEAINYIASDSDLNYRFFKLEPANQDFVIRILGAAFYCNTYYSLWTPRDSVSEFINNKTKK